jgi:zeaxanthin glucosyltransferase
MAHYAILCPDDAGHLLSMGPLGTELVRRGHRVTLVGLARSATFAKKQSLDFHEVSAEGVPFPFSLPVWLAFRLAGASGTATLRSWFCWRAELTLRLMPQALRDLAVDGVLIDHAVTAGATVAEHVGLPFVTVSTALPWNGEPDVPPHFTAWPLARSSFARWRNRLGYAAWRWYMRPTRKIINRYRRAWQLSSYAGIDEAVSPLVHISQLSAEFDFPRTHLPDTFHYIGSLATNRQLAADNEFPWDRLDGRPLVFASLGTVPDPSNVPVFRKILAACAGLNAQLVLALGTWSESKRPVREQLGEVPGDPILVDFAPQLALLDRAALLITHAGVNTVLEALIRGVPMVALPRSADQPGMAARVRHAGAGLLGSFGHSSRAQIRQMVEQVLADGSFRQRAASMGQSVLAAGGVERAADLAEEAFATRQPVRRK